MIKWPTKKKFLEIPSAVIYLWKLDILVKNVQKILYGEFVARNTLVFVDERNKQSPDQTPNTVVNLNHQKTNKNVFANWNRWNIWWLQNLRKETIIFQVFGQSDKKVKEVNIVQIKIKDSNGLNFVPKNMLTSKVLLC